MPLTEWQAAKAAAELADPEAEEEGGPPSGNAAAALAADEDTAAAATGAEEDEEVEEEEVIMLQVHVLLLDEGEFPCPGVVLELHDGPDAFSTWGYGSLAGLQKTFIHICLALCI